MTDKFESLPPTKPTTGLTWTEVFRVFWEEKPYEWLRLYGIVVLVCTLVVWPFIVISDCSTYWGDFPPKVPLIKSNGILRIRDEQRGIKTLHHYEFVTNTGQQFRISERQTTKTLYDLFNKNFPDVYVEGFVLRNGDGFFYPVLVRDSAGNVFVREEEQYSKLERAGDVYGVMIKTSPVCILLLLVFVFRLFQIKLTQKRNNNG